MAGLTKLARFARIYGPRRALVKAFGRLRLGRWPALPSLTLRPGIAIVGCGQFAFSTIAYFARRKARIVNCFDVETSSAESLARMYGVRAVSTAFDDMLSDPSVDCVYIASNHASHSDYAATALAAGKRVYVEKPVAVSHAQLSMLSAVERAQSGRLFAGYNRPFAGAIRDLRSHLVSPCGPLTLSCFVSGHRIPLDHWYRRPEEGTRICGNVGHWLDLAVHILSWRGLPDSWRISLQWSDSSARDDDVAISIASEYGDLVNIVLTARSEPFEGINETINLQWDDTIAKIDDFRRLAVWKDANLFRRRYWPKDVGHRRAVLQPFSDGARDWHEVELSSLLMLRIAQMVRDSRINSEFSFREELLAIGIETSARPLIQENGQ